MQTILAIAGDVERRLVHRKGNEIKLTPAEYNLLVYFIQNPDRPLTRDMILNSAWGYEAFPNTRTVDAHAMEYPPAPPVCGRPFIP